MTTRRAIDAKDLDAATRQRLGISGFSAENRKSDEQQGTTKREINEHLQRRRAAPRDEHAIAVKRVHTGRSFEADLAMTHQQYAFAKWGKLWPHAPPFVRIKSEWRPKSGGGPVDYTGHVHVVRAGETLIGARLAPHVRTVPVAFDAKVQDAKSAVYHHEQKRQHQLHALRDASATGTAAFLLVLAPQLDPPHGRVFAIDVAAHFTTLLSREGVRLFEPTSRADRPRGEPFLLLPSVARRATPPIAGWDWIPLLDWITNGS